MWYHLSVVAGKDRNNSGDSRGARDSKPYKSTYGTDTLGGSYCAPEERDSSSPSQSSWKSCGVRGEGRGEIMG